MTVEAARKYQRGEPLAYVTEWVSRGHFYLALCAFRTALQCSGGYYLESGDMPLHDAWLGLTNKGATTENQGAGVKYMG